MLHGFGIFLRKVAVVIAGVVGTTAIALADDASPPIRWIEGSTVPLLQLTGEKFQYYANCRYFKDDACAITLTKAGVYGTDLGVPVTFPDKIVILFGDTLSYYRANGNFIRWDGCGRTDSIGYIDRPVDLSACHAIENIDAQIAAGARQPKSDYSKSPKLKMFLKPKPIAGQPLFQETEIAKLAPGQGVGTSEVPTGGFALNDYLYVFYVVKCQDGVRFNLNSILARSDQTYTHWHTNAPPTFTRLFDVSLHPPLADMDHPPPDGNDYGKFMHVAPVVLEHATVVQTGMLPALPPSVRNAEAVIFLWGCSWHSGHSNLYLAVVAAGDIEATLDGDRDISKWWYFSGTSGAPTWTHDERAATPLLDTWTLPDHPSITPHSVIWSADLQQFVLAYTCYTADTVHRVKFRVASVAWGPWSTEMDTFNQNDTRWAVKLFHHQENNDRITKNDTSVYRMVKGQLQQYLAPEKQGKIYAPYMLDTTTKNADGSVTIYYILSTSNPYNSFLMRTSFKRAR